MERARDCMASKLEVSTKGQRAGSSERGDQHPVTLDGRYFVVRGRLWRRSNPQLSPAKREELTRELMNARRAKGVAMRLNDSAARETARKRVDTAKHALGERGPVWWDDGAPDYNRHMVKNTPYAGWFAGLPES